MEDLGDTTRWHVWRRADELNSRAEQILKELDAQKSQGVGLPMMSRETGVDMGYELELARRWSKLAREMRRSRAEFVADLGSCRLKHWKAALDPQRLRPSEPLKEFRPVQPRIRRTEVPTNRPFVPPHRRPPAA